MLEGNKHHAYKLQEFYNKNKTRKGFKITYEVLEKVDNVKHFNAREKYYIDLYDAHRDGFNSIGLDGSPTHTKQRTRINKKVERLNKEKNIYSNLISKYKDNLYIKYSSYNDTFLYRVNAAIKYFVKNYNLDLYLAEVTQYKSDIRLTVINKNFYIVQEYQYITQNQSMGLHKYIYRNSQDLHTYSERYAKFSNITQSKNRFKLFLKKFYLLDENIIKYNTIKYSDDKYSIPTKIAKEVIGYKYDKFKKHIIEDTEIQELSKSLGITYPHGRIELIVKVDDNY